MGAEKNLVAHTIEPEIDMSFAVYFTLVVRLMTPVRFALDHG